MDVAISPWGCNIHRSGSVGSYAYSVDPDWANRPVNYVSWGDAARFANWLHNGQPMGAQGLTTTEDGAYCLNGATSNEALMAVSRKSNAKWAITSEDEWYKAGYYKGGSTNAGYWNYPTGSDSRPNNTITTPDSGNSANFYGTVNDGSWSTGSPYYRTLAGEFENSGSPYGTFDQGGNVWEWNEAVIGTCRGLRGESCFLGDESHLRATYRGYYLPLDEQADIGFRVSDVPEPATLSLLALGGLALLSSTAQLRLARI
jgi:formylglycine-generating enzyme required for sulfatase activity